MSHRYTLDPQVNLHWVRETPSRALVSPVSQSLDSIERLPPCVQTAVRAVGLPSVELHLPPHRAASDPELSEWFAGLHFRQSANGRLVATHRDDAQPLATQATHQALVLICRAITGDTTPLTLIAEAPETPLLRRPLASRHTCARQGGLAAAPSERSHNYDRAYKSVAVAVQAALRATVPAAHIRTMDQLEDRPHSMALFAWGAAAPVVGRHVDQLGVDVLNARLLERTFGGMCMRLAPRLAEVWQLLHRHGAEPLYCNSYKPNKVEAIVNRYRRGDQFFHLLFANEMRLITAFVRFCVQIQGWRQRANGDPAIVYRSVVSAWEDVEVHIRSFYQRHPHPAIGSHLLLEAARTLEAID
jgi:hypothetical protein